MPGLRADMASEIKKCPTPQTWDTLALISLDFLEEWQPVGELNPSSQVENLVS